MNFVRNYRILITKLKLTHAIISNYITIISTRVTHGHDSTHIKPNKNMA
jgi:hypothetical protein